MAVPSASTSTSVAAGHGFLRRHRCGRGPPAGPTVRGALSLPPLSLHRSPPLSASLPSLSEAYVHVVVGAITKLCIFLCMFVTQYHLVKRMHVKTLHLSVQSSVGAHSIRYQNFTCAYFILYKNKLFLSGIQNAGIKKIHEQKRN